MRRMLAVACLSALAGCATKPPPRLALQRPHRRPPVAAASARPAAMAPPAMPARLQAPTPRLEGPGANVPLEGFRPMRGAAGAGA